MGRSTLKASRVGCGRVGRAQGRIDMWVERGLVGLGLRREPASTDTRSFSRMADTRWVVGAFTRIFFGP